MAHAPRDQCRRIGDLSLLLPPPPAPAQPLAGCLAGLEQRWRQEGALAGLWQAWPRIAGPQLAPHCRPLQWRAGILTVGARPGPWLQALQYNRHQLLGALRGAGFAVRDLRLQQHHPTAIPAPGSSQEQDTWARHPSRIDVHGLADCPACGRPAPAGEMALWGHCSFCRRQSLAASAPPPGADASPPEPAASPQAPAPATAALMPPAGPGGPAAPKAETAPPQAADASAPAPASNKPRQQRS